MISLRDLEAEFKPKMHKALRFDRVDDYVNIGNSDYFNKVTLPLFNTKTPAVFAWIYPRRLDVVQFIFLHAKDWSSTWNSQSYVLYLDSQGRITFRYTNGIDHDIVVSDPLPATNRLYFVGGQADGSKVQLILDGEITKELSQTIEVLSEGYYNVVGAEYNSYKHANNNPPWYYNIFDGLIYAVYVYREPLSKSEIKHLYHNPFDPPNLDSLVLWLTPASIDTANGKWWDLSGKNHHGVIYGCAEVKLTEEEVIVL